MPSVSTRGKTGKKTKAKTKSRSKGLSGLRARKERRRQKELRKLRKELQTSPEFSRAKAQRKSPTKYNRRTGRPIRRTAGLLSADKMEEKFGVPFKKGYYK